MFNVLCRRLAVLADNDRSCVAALATSFFYQKAKQNHCKSNTCFANDAPEAGTAFSCVCSYVYECLRKHEKHEHTSCYE